MGTTDARETTLPTLSSGVTLLHRPSVRAAAVARLVVDELGRREGRTYWVDAASHASTYALYDLAPSPRRLADVRVARAFTAYQHHALVRRATRRVDGDTALLVAPAVTRLYGDADVPDADAAELLDESLALLAEAAETHDVPVLASVGPGAPLAERVEGLVDREIHCVDTDLGLRFEGEGFETTVYRRPGYWQTTIPYWVDLFGAAEAFEREYALGSASGDPVAAPDLDADWGPAGVV